MINVSDLKPGVTFQMDGNLFVVLDYSHNKTARAAANIKVKMKNLRTGSTTEMTFGGNDKVKRAVENYEVLTGDEEVKRLSEIRLMSNLEEKSALHCAREEGREEGKKHGEEIGLKRGKKETEQKLKEIAQKLKEQKMLIKQIAEITGLSEKK